MYTINNFQTKYIASLFVVLIINTRLYHKFLGKKSNEFECDDFESSISFTLLKVITLK